VVLNDRRFTALLLAIVDGIGISRLPKLLHQAGCRVTLFAPRGLMVGRSRYVDQQVGTSHDAARLSVELGQWLGRLERPYDLAIVGDEVFLHALAAWRGERWASQILPVPVQGPALDLILSKHKFMAAAARAGLAVPRSEPFETWDEALRTAEQIGFPVMLKKSVGFAGTGVRKAVSPEDLRLAYDQLGSGDLVLEDFIPGPVGLTEALFDRGRLLAWVSSYNLRSWPTPLSPSCVREITDHRDVTRLAHGIGAFTAFSGFVGIDWIHDQEHDRLVLIELNPRPTPGLQPRAGVDFALALRSVLEGNPVEQQPDPSCHDTLWMFPQSIHRAIDDRDPRGILRAFRDAPMDDPRLAASALRRVVTHYLPGALRRHPTAASP
jgi:hypothetical protein